MSSREASSLAPDPRPDGDDVHAEPKVSWGRLRLISLIVATVISLLCTPWAGGIVAILIGTGLIAFDLIVPSKKALVCAAMLCSGFALIGAVTPTVALLLPVLIPVLFARFHLRVALLPVTVLFILTGASFVWHDVQPRMGAFVPLVIGYVLSLLACWWMTQILTISEERAEALTALRESREHIAELSRRSGIEMERLRLAREVHDGATQRIVVLQMLLDSLAAQTPDDDVRAEKIKLARTEAHEGLKELRGLLAQAQADPEHEIGVRLGDEAQRTAAAFRVAAGLNLTTDIDVAKLNALPQGLPLSDTVLRALSETLTNVATHAEAQHCWVQLHVSSSAVHLRVDDDGRGWSTDTPQPRKGHGFGLSSMRTRVESIGGSLQLAESRCGGAHVHAVVPLPREEV